MAGCTVTVENGRGLDPALTRAALVEAHRPPGRRSRRTGRLNPSAGKRRAGRIGERRACRPEPDRTRWLSGPKPRPHSVDGRSKPHVHGHSDSTDGLSPGPAGPPPLHRITVDEYEKIIAAGALEDPSRVELIDGYMVDKMAKNAEHSYTTKETLKALDRRLPAGWTSRKEEPVRIPAYDEPEPDIAIVRGTDADYEFRLPRAADVALLVEVSDSTLSQDRGKKHLSYAKSTDPRLLDRQPGRPPGRGLHSAG